MRPQDVKFAKTHEWARLEANSSIVTVGISDYAVERLGDIVFIELPEVGTSLTRESPFGVIESVKAAVDLIAPVSGQVTQVNQDLSQQFDVLSNDPFGQAWMIKIQASDTTQLHALMSPSDYQAFIETTEAEQ